MDYKQKYEEALERAKYLKENTDSVGAKDISYTFEQIFPELKESEDEKIRKELIERFKWELKGAEEQDAAGCSRQKDIAMFKQGIAWLEKQGKKNHVEYNIYNAKKGDILSYKNIVLIVDSIGTFEGRTIINSWYFADSKKFYGKGTSECDRWDAENFQPASKLEKNYLFKMMKESGYEWDADNKELKKIEHPAWSKDDEKMYESILTDTVQENTLDNRQIHWIRSLKDRVQPQYKQELNDEYQSMIDDIISLIQDAPGCLESDKEKMIDWLKSPKPHWKPTKEQMEALKCSYKSYIIDGKERRTLESLYNDLKKL